MTSKSDCMDAGDGKARRQQPIVQSHGRRFGALKQLVWKKSCDGFEATICLFDDWYYYEINTEIAEPSVWWNFNGGFNESVATVDKAKAECWKHYRRQIARLFEKSVD